MSKTPRSRKPAKSRPNAGTRRPRHHDHSYKQLFAHPEMVRDLLTGFVHERWVASVDLGSLEAVKASFITDDFREREDDVIWRVRWADGWLYVYILIEFQSRVDAFMGVRIANYVSLLYQDLLARQALTDDDFLPPVLPIMLYNGESRWSAPTDLHALIEAVPGGLEAYRPHWAYLLLDEGAIIGNADYPLEVRNLAAALFQLEKARDESTWLAVYARLVEVLDSQALDSLKRAFGRWIYKSFIRRKRPGIRLPDIDDFHEVHVMLQQRVKQWNTEIREQGRLEGRLEGRQENQRSTALAMLQRTTLDEATIAELTGLSVEEVRALRNGPSHH